MSAHPVPTSGTIHRHAVRAIILTPECEVLLMRIRAPDIAPFWIAPGGGVEAGETAEACLRRELREELGLETFDPGPLVWRRRHTFIWNGRRICQSEDYHVVRAARFEPVMGDAVEAEVLLGFRWWPAAELEGARERLTPLSLGRIVGNFLAEGAPVPVPEIEVVVD